MPETQPSEVTQLLAQAGGGDPQAAARLLPLVYDELRRQYRSTGVLMYCCGAPVDLLGMEDEFALARETILCMAESVGAEELIVACPDCARNAARSAA